MIVKKSTTNTKKTIYQCDRCKRKQTFKNDHKIYIVDTGYLNPTKKWDLCDRCYRALVRGIEAGTKRKENKENGV